MSKNFSYEAAKAYVKDKDVVINTFIKTSLDKTQQIFAYANLPDTIPYSELENLIQRNGHCIIAKVDGELYAFTGGFSGENNVYNKPKNYVVSNTALNHYKTYEIGVDCVLIKNDYNAVGLLPIIQKYGVLLTDSEISLNTAAVLSRIAMLISAPDDRTKASADLFVQKILNGDFSVIGENGFFDGVKMHTTSTTNGNLIIQMIELVQYYKASFYNEIGLQANYNMKREALNTSEVAMNVDVLLPFIENMYNERVTAITAVNKMFDTDIIIDYNGAWKATQEHSDKEEEAIETDSTTIATNVEIMETKIEDFETDGNETETDGNETETDGNETETDETNVEINNENEVNEDEESQRNSN